jgi:phosphate-selective porin
VSGLGACLVALAVTCGRAAAQDAPAKPAGGGTTVDASRGGVTIASGHNSLTINARTQIRWTLDDRELADADTTGAGVGEADGPVSQFDVPRLRLTLSGGAYRPWLRYSLQFELGRTSGEGGSRIKDAYLELRPTGRAYRVTVGQFKVPFGLQQLTSSSRLQFADRAITDAKFNPARDMGAMFSGTARDRLVGYEVGVFNGAGESNRQNTDTHLWAGRVYVHPLGAYPLSEGSLDAESRGRLHVGLGVRGGKQIRGRTTAGILEQSDGQRAFNLEFAYKRPRFFTTAEYFWMVDEQSNPVRRPDLSSRGYHAQAGYMVQPRRTEVGVLVARIDPDVDADDASVGELRGVVNYFFEGHNLKLQADAGRVTFGARYAAVASRARQGMPGLGARLSQGEDLADRQVRVQLQLAF